ncbi:MAG: hypothetical protein D6706_18430 [Chloroflexi bacterium]|nr:MAG: hypothetical protein D6706_18430 [Chloroflexota bacterium]
MLNARRLAFLRQGLLELPDLPELHQVGRNGEELATDEAAVWKRVLNYRIAKHIQPQRILETHAGLGISTVLYMHACPSAEIVALCDWQQATITGQFDLIDVDPFGLPYDCLEFVCSYLAPQGVLMVSNGEALAVWRNLRRQQYIPTSNFGKRMPVWVCNEYLPRIAEITQVPVRFFYAFPSSIRVILSRRTLPDALWQGCKQWMWWLERYANQTQNRLF